MRPIPTRDRVAGPPSRRAPVLTLATALAATLIGALPAVAAGAPAFASAAQAANAAKAAQDDQQNMSPEAKASAKASTDAKRTGKRVEVPSLRSETDEVWANPDGSFTSEQSLVPTRVRRGGAYVPVDTGLAKQKDGRIAPKATVAGLSFSGGGNAPLVTMRKDGRDITLSWPKPLPAPTVQGNSATYAEVMKGVDLRVSADVTGFSHQLVVKNREAAANPELASVDFGLKGNGVTVRKEANGELRAVDPAGQTLFSSAKPQMWDSGADKPAAQPPAAKPAGDAKAVAEAKAAAGAKAGALAAPAAGATPAPSADRVPAVDGISLGTKQADLGVALKADKLTLTTDRNLLTAADTTFPVVIDPVWRDDWKSAWAVAYKHNAIPGSASTNYWNGGTLSNDARVGCAKDAQRGNAVVCAKTFFQVGMGGLGGKQILDATLRIQQKSAGSWSCKSGDIQVWDTDAISGSTTWNNQPAWKRMVDASGQSYGGRNCPGDGDTIELNVTSAVADAARWSWPAWTFGLKSANDTVDVSWRKMNPDSVRISTQYNTLPNAIPANERSMHPSVPCAGGEIGITDEVVLRARITDAEDNKVWAEFNYWNADDYWGTIQRPKVEITNGNVAIVRIPKGDLPGTNYVWDVRGTDGSGEGPWAGRCSFTIDREAPRWAPGVSSPQFPEDDQKNNAYARTEGTFTFTPNGVTDVAKYQWHTASDPTVRTVNVTATDKSAQIKYTPTAAGMHSLFVWSLDASGNRSSATSYVYHAKRQANRDKHGDLDGNGTVDIWSVDPGSGRLWMHPGNGDGSFEPSKKLDRGSFANAASLTHRGSWDADYYEDLVALRPAPDNSRKNLYLYRGNGDGDLEHTDAGAIEMSTQYSSDDRWGQADQVVAIGSVNDDIDPILEAGDGKIDAADNPDLLVKEGSNLWLYAGTPSGTLGLRNFRPIPLGNADWQDMTLIAPGDLNKDGLPEIWARNKTTGKIHQYTSRKTTDTTAAVALDLTVYADPAVRTTSIGTGFTGAAYPHLASNGDFENDGFVDLWSRNGDGAITEFPGRALSNGSAFGPGKPLVLGGTPWNECETVPSSADAGVKHSLCGPLLAKFKAAGGLASFGKPTGPVGVAADDGRFMHFRMNGYTYDNASIYWHRNTGAWIVMNGNREKWISLGAETGFLGYPTSDEIRNSDGVGVVSTFRGSGGDGAIYWSEQTGSWSIHGTIYKRYLAAGGPGGWLGYPTTDEVGNPDGVGRYNHFRQRGQTSDTASIYWTSTTRKALAVWGGIRNKWVSLGAEKSFLGYPKSEEYEVYGGPRTDFDGGYIRHNDTTGVSVEHKPNDRTAHLRTDLAGDFNGDGRSDMATVYDYGSDNTALYTLAGKTDGGFAAPVLAYETGKGNWRYSQSQWVVGDFNNDGRDDLAALYDYQWGENAMFTFLGQADGTFVQLGKSAHVPAGSWEPGKAKLVAGDFNGDKRDDVAFFYDHGGSTGAHTFLSKPDGSFNASFGSWRSAQGGWYWNESKQVAGDFNGDGRDDILAVYGSGNGTVTAYTLLGKADGGFAAPVASWTRTPGNWEFNKSRITSGDYNGDGRADLAILYDYTGGKAALFTLTGRPDGGINADFKSWESPVDSWWSGSYGMPVSGDSNKDGREDIAIMYNYGTGATAAFTFKARTDGGFDSPLKSWQAAPGTW
ncbi:FG-GAP-like repeat-containing protein [Streptomyces venezuelae]|uniref:FG-GAP-like repeat-containing protein n=1 Tax=Streptomyces venezuelae TaxID=54571 RepID=UPI00123A1DAF|nr:FG-GAP-like repeat-containing protein [Streptomyces venezuelae]